MPKEDLVKMEGVIIDVLPNGNFRVDINGHQILAYTSGNMRKNKIKIIEEDRVSVEITPYDLNRGRIVYRFK
jgi:translation initiation factor IF-1